MSKRSDIDADKLAAWWRTDIISIAPGQIRMRGYPIEELIGRIGFCEMIWLMLRGELPSPKQASLLQAALVAAVDHGPQAPSIAIARMAMTCGLGINNAMASAINALGDVHGGAGQQCLELYEAIAVLTASGVSLSEASRQEIERRLDAGEHIPGFGHRFHGIDPRAGRLLALVAEVAGSDGVTGRFKQIGEAVEAALAQIKGKTVPMNIDGATAVIYGELGLPSPLARGLFVLSRSVGILAHAWEQHEQGGRIKGPMPPSVSYRYEGEALRHIEEANR
ncbi:citryl-CoA lyase [Bradyrhizobium sp. Pear76]|uniref:citryl-CoA lyase n=1 Tax=Bradyrhizobium oropedii TaxID=1571201 RepID=UPI001E52D621|nr:citryl-CoA lyase [Bradyrhizobium oropedii]MCC8961606.1 citryl-CoA lyase [Bradyrhizobium oropedii]